MDVDDHPRGRSGGPEAAFPEDYNDDVVVAIDLLGAGPGPTAVEAAVYFGGASPDTCVPSGAGFTGEVVYPLSGGTEYVDQANFGNAGALWESTHSGTDFAAACGEPVVAATDGVVTIRTDQSWAGAWLVQIDAGRGGVVTWYAHMQHVEVSTGDRVAAGEPIGEVGSQGNSTGCHLHFEVHPDGGVAVDPTTWLSQNVGDDLGTVVPALAEAETVRTEDVAVLITANIPFWLTDETVERRIHQLLGRTPDVLVLQEMRGRNVPAMVGRARGAWAAWQPPRSERTVIVWNANRFIAARRGAAFGVDTGAYESWMPWVLLKSDAGTLPVVGIHMPTNASKSSRMAGYFRAMTERYQKLFRQLNAAGYPPIAGGDWNHPLGNTREWWSPVPMLRQVGLTTNWRKGTPCAGTSANDGRIDGFAFNPRYLQVIDQGCLDRGPSDHRPVWVAVAPVG